MGYDLHEQGSHVGSSAINLCSHVIGEMPGIQRTTKANPDTLIIQKLIIQISVVAYIPFSLFLRLECLYKSPINHKTKRFPV